MPFDIYFAAICNANFGYCRADHSVFFKKKAFSNAVRDKGESLRWNEVMRKHDGIIGVLKTPLFLPSFGITRVYHSAGDTLVRRETTR
jgi:hypothetical protein